jgi:hypothetical protein
MRKPTEVTVNGASDTPDCHIRETGYIPADEQGAITIALKPGAWYAIEVTVSEGKRTVQVTEL